VTDPQETARLTETAEKHRLADVAAENSMAGV
jgi:hypothetical protein